MEVVFQNKRQDFDAFYTYIVKDTEQGKRLRRLLFRNFLVAVLLVCMLLGALAWGFFGKWQIGLGVTIVMLLAYGAVKILITGFQPIYIPAIEYYKKQEKFITQRELQIFQLSRTITIDDQWLEIRNSEAVHRWRWRQVERISLTPNFIFLHVGNCPIVYIPKRDFQSEQNFIEFGNKLIELKEKNKDQAIGAE